MGARKISPPTVTGLGLRRRRRELTEVRRMDAAWGDTPVPDLEFLDIEPDPTDVGAPRMVELDVEPDPETATFMMVDLVFDEESGPHETPMAKIEPKVPTSTTGAPRVLSRPRSPSRPIATRRRPRGAAPTRPNPSTVVTEARDPFPDALDDGALAKLIRDCTKEICGF